MPDEKSSNSVEINDINIEKEKDFSFENINIQKLPSPEKYDTINKTKFIEINHFLLSPINETYQKISPLELFFEIIGEYF